MIPTVNILYIPDVTLFRNNWTTMIIVTTSDRISQADDIDAQVADAVARIAPEAKQMLLALAQEMGARYPNHGMKKPQRALRLVRCN